MRYYPQLFTQGAWGTMYSFLLRGEKCLQMSEVPCTPSSSRETESCEVPNVISSSGDDDAMSASSEERDILSPLVIGERVHTACSCLLPPLHSYPLSPEERYDDAKLYSTGVKQISNSRKIFFLHFVS